MVEEISILVAVFLILVTFFLVRGNVRLSDNCPKCGNNNHVKRVSRSFLTKYLFFVFGARKLRCSKCWKNFFQLWAVRKPDPKPTASDY